MLRTILIDDEAKARENLRILLTRYCKDDIELIEECDTIEKAYTSVNELRPHLIFLDIEMGRASGFDLLNRFKQYPFKVVFITAFDQYAIKAIRFSALDYLLKPVSVTDLRNAVSKVKKSIHSERELHFETLLNFINNPQRKSNRIAIPVQNGYHLIPVDQIMYCEAHKEYTYINLFKKETICSSLNLGEYEELLEGYDFFRVHHSYLVNRQYIQNYIRGEGGEIVINHQQRIPISRRKKEDFLRWLKQ
ncbi:MAG: response regulator transcription factor [Bacteroidetes bacterium]|nr:MAG: response regulator transcription factor [Bacteroidota bacterium]